jgi:hypothetical protein
MIFVRSRNVNLPATLTNKVMCLTEWYVLIYKKDERGEISRFEFVSKF